MEENVGREEVEGEKEKEDLEEDPKEEPMEERERRQFYFNPNNTWEEEVLPEGESNPNESDHQEDMNQHCSSREAMEVDGLPIINEEPNVGDDLSWRNVYLIGDQDHLQSKPHSSTLLKLYLVLLCLQNQREMSSLLSLGQGNNKRRRMYFQ